MTYLYSPIPSPISASSYRSCELTSLSYRPGFVVLDLVDDNGSKWRLTFTNTQACKVTTEECASEIMDRLPKGGGVFAASESDWLTGLGKGQVHFMDESKHFVVPCYDEVVEVVAWNLDVESGPAVA